MKSKNVAEAPALEMIKKISISTLIGALFTFVVLCVMAFILSMQDIPTSATGAMSSTAAGVGAFAAGFAAAKIHKRQGALVGAAAGAMLFVVILLVSMIVTGSFMSFQVLLRLILMILASTVAGIIGVNMRGRRKKI